MATIPVSRLPFGARPPARAPGPLILLLIDWQTSLSRPGKRCQGSLPLVAGPKLRTFLSGLRDQHALHRWCHANLVKPNIHLHV